MGLVDIEFLEKKSDAFEDIMYLIYTTFVIQCFSFVKFIFRVMNLHNGFKDSFLS